MTSIQPNYSPEEMLARLVGFDTTSRLSNLALIDFVDEYLQAWGAKTHRIHNPDYNKANLFATLGPDVDGGVVLSGHTDVVPVDGQDWSSDPFNLVARDGKLYGRGSCDMKGFIAAALACLPAYKAGTAKTPLHFALSYDEEVGCMGVHGMIDFMAETGLRPKACIVGEPSMMKVVNAHKGIRTFETRIRGLESHSSRTDLGASAIMAAAQLISFLDNLAKEKAASPYAHSRFHPPYTTIQVGTIKGGTAVNIVPKDCLFEWEYRTISGESDDAVIEAFEEHVAKVVLPDLQKNYPEATIETTYHANAPALVPQDGCAAEELVRAITKLNSLEAVSYATEAGVFQKVLNIPTVVCGPGSIEQAHKPDEYVSVSQLEQCAGFLTKLYRHMS